MLKKLIALVMICSLTTFIFADGTEPSGSGTAADPYQVSTLDNLLWISTNESSWGDDFIQTEDIDASDTENWNSGAGWLPIGEGFVYSFTGTYDGQGYSISNLYINRPDRSMVGLFGITNEATIENLGVVDCNITGGPSVGGLLGYQQAYPQSSLVNHCYATGLVAGESLVGGLLGCAYGSVTNCYATCSVSAIDCYGGGLIGWVYESSVATCYATGSVSGYQDNGGLIGRQLGGTVTNCYATCSVSATSYNDGGLIGYQGDGASVTNCYATGLVSGSSSVGGLIGRKYQSTVTSSYWDTQTSGQSTSDGGTGKTTTEMKIQSTYIDWDFTNTWIIRTCHNDSYPYLQDNNIVSVDPEAESSFKEMHVLNYPNPLRNQTTISYSIKGVGNNETVDVRIFNLKGQLVESTKAAGGSVELNTEHYTPGIYFYKVAHEKKTLTGKMMIVK